VLGKGVWVESMSFSKKTPASLPLAGLACLLALVAQSSDWVSIFNGRDLSGWEVQCKPADRQHQFWKVEDGVIVADSMDIPRHDYVWLITKKEYTNFALRLKFQVFTNSPGNSGVQVRSRYDTNAFWLDGPQVDINPPAPWRTGMIWDETRGVQRWIYPNLPKGQWVKPEQAPSGMKFFFSHQSPAWNELEITVQGNRIHAVLNGVVVTDFDGTGILDDEIHQKRRVGNCGHIALQIHTGDRLKIHFKDIWLRELN